MTWATTDPSIRLVSSVTEGLGPATFWLGNPISETYHPTSENAGDLAKYFGFYFQNEYEVTKRLRCDEGNGTTRATR